MTEMERVAQSYKEARMAFYEAKLANLQRKTGQTFRAERRAMEALDASESELHRVAMGAVEKEAGR